MQSKYSNMSRANNREVVHYYGEYSVSCRSIDFRPIYASIRPLALALLMRFAGGYSARLALL